MPFTAYSEYLQQQYQHLRGQHQQSALPSNGVPRQQRPPLPDYNTATHHLARSQQTAGAKGLRPHHARSHSLEGYLQQHQQPQYYSAVTGKPQLVPVVGVRPPQQDEEELVDGRWHIITLFILQ